MVQGMNLHREYAIWIPLRTDLVHLVHILKRTYSKWGWSILAPLVLHKGLGMGNCLH